MSIASSQQSFLITPLIQNPKAKIPISTAISCRHSPDDLKTDSCSRKHENQLEKLAIVTLAAEVLTLGSVGDAYAAKSGGRVGGQAFKSSAPRSSPRINNNNSSKIFHGNEPNATIKTSNKDMTRRQLKL